MHVFRFSLSFWFSVISVISLIWPSLNQKCADTPWGWHPRALWPATEYRPPGQVWASAFARCREIGRWEILAQVVLKRARPKKTWEQWHFPLHSAWEVRESEPSRWFRLDSDPKEHLFVALLVPISWTQSPVSLRSVNGVWRDNIHSCPCKTNNSQLLRRTRHCQTKSNSIPTWPVKR